MPEHLSKKEAVSFLEIDEKEFDNYHQKSSEIRGEKKNGRWYFEKTFLAEWKSLKRNRTVRLTLREYEECFELAIKMSYGSKSSHGTGIRGVRSEMQQADDWILGILGEYGLRKFLSESFNKDIRLDTDAHPDHITSQDIVSVKSGGDWREPKINVAVKASKFKNCFLVLPEIEYENEGRKSDLYVFIRVGLPSDHLFRILRDHSFFKNVKDFLEDDPRFRKIGKLEEIPVWICGYAKHADLEKVTEIPGQKFDQGYRYVKSVAGLKNSDLDWATFASLL